MNHINKKRINMYELLICLTNAGDLVCPKLANHHQQVAYLAFRLGQQMNLPQSQQRDLMLAGLLHDVGALSYQERLDLIDQEPPSAHDHAFKGARLLEGFAPLNKASEIIRYHHVPWNRGKGRLMLGKQVPQLSHILHLADRIAVQIDPDQEVIGQIENIVSVIQKQKQTKFVPEYVDAFLDLSVNEYIWLDLVYQPLLYILPHLMAFSTMELDINGIIDLTKVFAKIIDYKSPYTANHSAGVAKTAEKLAELAGFSEDERKMMLIAGYLHDFGKLAVKNEILDKPGKLDVDDFNSIRSHTFYTFRLLQSIREFETINMWASFHHEKLNGTGYPFHLSGESLPLGSRIMAVADVFTAISEDRPYRRGMTQEQVIAVFNTMVEEQSLCPYVVSLLMDNLEQLQKVRKAAQRKADTDYNDFLEKTQISHRQEKKKPGAGGMAGS